MPENKTKKTEVSVDAFLDKVADEDQRADSYTLLELMKDITGLPPKMWGPSIIGFGEYHYQYASGHEGDICMIGFSPRKGNLTLYLMANGEEYAPMLAKLGKHKTSKACLYINRLAEVDRKVLRAMIERAYAQACAKHLPEPKQETPAKKTPKKKPGAKS